MIAENDRPYNAFLRLAVHMCDLRQTLNECSNVVAEPAAWDLSYVADQVSEQIDTLEIMARDAGKYWGEIQHDIAKAAGSLNLDRPADNVSQCHSIIHVAWQTWNRLSRQRQRDPADRVRAFAKLADLLRLFEDRDTWENRIAKEFRAMAATADKPDEAIPSERADTLPDDSLRTMAGDIVLRNELTEEDRPSSEWARICKFDPDTFRNRMLPERRGPTWRIVETGSQRYRVHVEDLPQSFRGSKKQRDEFLKPVKD